MLLGTILDLQLHTHADAVEEISDQSVKEEKMENTLAKLDELWFVIQQLQYYNINSIGLYGM